MAELTLSRRSPAPDRNGDGGRPRHARWVYAIAAGAVAGIAYIVLQSVPRSLLYGDGVWEPFHRIAAMALGASALEDVDAFDPNVIGTAIVIHLGLSAFYGVVLSYIISEFTRRNAPWLGVIAGLLIYVVNFYGFAGLFPWMTELRGGLTLFAHAVFGALLGSCYWALYADRPAARLSGA